MATQEQRLEQTRKRLLDAGRECIYELGFTGTTEAAICERASVSRGAIHHHFDTGKSGLLNAIIEQLYQRQIDRFTQAPDLDPDTILLGTIDQAIKGIERGAGDIDQIVLTELWLACRASHKVSASLATTIHACQQRFWLALEERYRSRGDWDQKRLTLGFLVRSYLRGLAIERAVPAAPNINQKEQLASLQILREMLAAYLREHPAQST